MSAYEPSNLYINEPFIHPEHLVVGKPYAWCERNASEIPPRFSQVILLAYDACPAFVIIQSETGKLRCLRQELMDSPDSPPSDH